MAKKTFVQQLKEIGITDTKVIKHFYYYVASNNLTHSVKGVTQVYTKPGWVGFVWEETGEILETTWPLNK